MSSVQQSLPVKTLSNGDVVSKIADGVTPSQLLSVDSSGRIIAKLDDGAGNAITSQANGSQRALDVGIDVAGVQIDPRQVRTLTASDTVTAQQGTSPWVSKDQANGPVTPGTVASFSELIGGQFNTALPTLANGQQAAVQLDSSGRVLIGSISSALPAGANNIGSVNQGTSPWVVGQSTAANLNAQVNLRDGLGNAITSSSAGSTRPLDAALRDNAGNLYSGTNPFPVVVSSVFSGTQVNKYNTSAAVAAGASVNHDYAVTASKIFYGKKFFASSAGMLRVDVQISPDGITFTTFWTGFTSTANPCLQIDLDTLNIQDSGAGAKVRMVLTNFETAQAEDVFSTISGTELP